MSSPVGIGPIDLEAIDTVVDLLAFAFSLAAFLEGALDILVADPNSYTRWAEDMIVAGDYSSSQHTDVQLPVSITDGDIR